jgi:AcrR family transcriptional regulator
MTTKQTRTAKKMLDEMSGAEVAAQFGVSRGTLYRHLGNLKRV